MEGGSQAQDHGQAIYAKIRYSVLSNFATGCSFQRGNIQIVSGVMAEDHWFSDEELEALWNGAYDRWEQLGGATVRGPLFQFTMQPIGLRRRWLEVVEWAQFNAQLRQLRDPVPGDNIGMALTEALHQATVTELNRE